MLGTNLEKKEQGNEVLVPGETPVLVYNGKYLEEQ